MTAQSPAVRLSHPPETLLRIANRGVRILLRTPLAASLLDQMMVVSFSGRKSGRKYSIPLSAHLIDDQLYAMGLKFRDPRIPTVEDFADAVDRDRIAAIRFIGH